MFVSATVAWETITNHIPAEVLELSLARMARNPDSCDSAPMMALRTVFLGTSPLKTVPEETIYIYTYMIHDIWHMVLIIAALDHPKHSHQFAPIANVSIGQYMSVV